jgi:hypothetical protein
MFRKKQRNVSEMSEKNGNECIGIILGHTAAAKQRPSMPEVRERGGGKVRKAKGRKAIRQEVS